MRSYTTRKSDRVLRSLFFPICFLPYLGGAGFRRHHSFCPVPSAATVPDLLSSLPFFRWGLGHSGEQDAGCSLLPAGACVTAESRMREYSFPRSHPPLGSGSQRKVGCGALSPARRGRGESEFYPGIRLLARALGTGFAKVGRVLPFRLLFRPGFRPVWVFARSGFSPGFLSVRSARGVCSTAPPVCLYGSSRTAFGYGLSEFRFPKIMLCTPCRSRHRWQWPRRSSRPHPTRQDKSPGCKCPSLPPYPRLSR